MGPVAWKLVVSSLGALALSAFVAGCASTPGAVPRPFPMPARAADPAEPRPGTVVTAPSVGARTNASVDTYALVGTALQLRGTPYRNGGSDPLGFDCSGFTQYVFAQYHVPLPREVREQFRIGERVELRELAPGDLMFFATTDSGVSHVAIAVGSDEFVHAPSETGVVRVERLSSSYWAPRYLGARRVTQP